MEPGYLDFGTTLTRRFADLVCRLDATNEKGNEQTKEAAHNCRKKIEVLRMQ